MKKIAIIGGGASGLVAAIAAARTNPQAQILIYEKKDSAGKKILATGNGRCNLTNKDMNASYFHSDNLSVVEEVLQKFGYEDTIAFFTSLGLLTKARGNYVYPYSDQASTVLDLLKSELDRLHVKITTDVTVTGISPTSHGFTVLTDHQKQKADAVILACGGKANSRLGSDGSGYALAKELGHTMVPVVPALVQLKVKNHPFAKAAGVRTDAVVTAVCHGQPAASDHGELQLTAYGISGIPVFQISRYASRALEENKKVSVSLNFFPAYTETELREFLKKRQERCPWLGKQEIFTGILPEKLAKVLLKQKDPLKAAADFSLSIRDTSGFEQAQVCAGGVDTMEIHPETMESVLHKGLYFAGEIVDIDGPCGGYNLQWAWSSGAVAGRSSAKELI